MLARVVNYLYISFKKLAEKIVSLFVTYTSYTTKELDMICQLSH